MKNLLATALFSALFLFASAQKSPVKFGDIPMDDMKMTAYELDSSASAVILVDYGKAYVNKPAPNEPLYSYFEKHIRIKILKKDGLKWADAMIPLFYSMSYEDRVSDFKAVTYNLENGKIVETKMTNEGVFKEKLTANILLQKFTLPNVKEGSIIEYKYTVMAWSLLNFPNWRFQSTIPTRLSQYWAIIPDFFEMKRYVQGYVTLTPSEPEYRDRILAHNTDSYNRNSTYEQAIHYNDIAYGWTATNVPAFKEEPFMTSEEDYISKMNFALSYIHFPGEASVEVMGSWKRLNDQLLENENFEKIITGSYFLNKKVEELLAGETDPYKKIEKIFKYVRETLEWDGNKDFTSDKVKEIFEKKKGTSGDINLTLASMLEKAGIDVDMILLSTRDHGFIREEYPMSRQFNYTVCGVRHAGKLILLDATDKFLPMGVLPERCLNGKGMMVSATFHGWVPLESKTKARTVINADLQLQATGELKGKLDFSRDGYDAAEMRSKYKSMGESEYLKKSVINKPSWSVDKTVFLNMAEIEKSVKENHELTISDHTTVASDLIYINPFVTGQLEKNPFTIDNREYPVDYGSLKEKMYICKITIPEGYAVEELPQNKIINLLKVPLNTVTV